MIPFSRGLAVTPRLPGPPRKDWKDEKIFSDESTEDMKKLQEMDRKSKTTSKRLEKEDSNLKEVIQKEKQSVEDYEKRKRELQDEVFFCVCWMFVFFVFSPFPNKPRMHSFF